MVNIKYLLSLNRYSRNGKKNNNPRMIVIHHGEKDNYGAIETRNYFENLKSGKNAVYYSTHYIVGFEGEIIQCVPEEEVAYHRGNCEESSGSISITCCMKDKRKPPEINSVNSIKALVRDISKRYGLDISKDLMRHFDISGARCPFYYALNSNVWECLKKEIENENSIAERLTVDSNVIAERLSGFLGMEKRYLKEVLEEKAYLNIEAMSRISNLLLENIDCNL